MKKQPFYLTTTLPYVNANPHIGFALEIVQADAICRYQRLLGKEVIFNTGTDEHGKKIHEKAQEHGKETQAYTDEYAAKFDALKQALNLSYNKFIRTTDPKHKAAAQEFWKRCEANGDIYKKNYQTKYCVGCELEKTDSELVDGKCPDHPTREIELVDEENYFFKFSAYQEKLLELYKNNPEFVVPANRQLEITNFVAKGLQDFSISRVKSKMPWGVSVPGDDDHVMYVWFDALVNYISTLGWPDEGAEGEYAQYWPGVQVAGKDNLRQQSAMWQAMLMSAGLPTSTQVFIHGYVTAEGQKMSKSTGNVVNPYDVVEKYGTDAVRYYLLGALPSYEDGDWSEERFEEFYTAHLANGIGNLTSRILTMVEKFGDGGIGQVVEPLFDVDQFWNEYDKYMAAYKFDDLISHINNIVKLCDETISEQKPWEQVKQGKDVSALIYQLAETLRHIAVALTPIIPHSAEMILTNLGQVKNEQKRTWGKLQSGTKITKGEPLFPRLNT